MTDGRPEAHPPSREHHRQAPQAASTTTKPTQAASATVKHPSREHHHQAPQAASATVKSAPSPISTASTQNVKRSTHRTNTSNEGDRPAPTGPFDYPITLKTTLL